MVTDMVLITVRVRVDQAQYHTQSCSGGLGSGLVRLSTTLKAAVAVAVVVRVSVRVTVKFST